MSMPLSEHINEIAAAIRSRERILLFSDFDGTLVPILAHPDECFLDPAVEKTLSELASRTRIYLGIVSGRRLSDLRPRVRLDGIAYAGNHGLEIEGPDFSFREPFAAKMATELRRVVNNLSSAIHAFPGAWIQDNGLSASIHYRQVEPANAQTLIDNVHRIVASELEAKKFVLRSGKKVIEIRPGVDWNKGHAVRWIANRVSSPDREPLVIYLGDDETDEDAFTALPMGITICVGKKPHTNARYMVRDPEEVHGFLQLLPNLTVHIPQP